MTLLQFEGDAAGLVEDVAERLAGISPLLQVRAFVGTAARSRPPRSCSRRRPSRSCRLGTAGAARTGFGTSAASLRIAHHYTKYSRRDAFAGVLTRVDDR